MEIYLEIGGEDPGGPDNRSWEEPFKGLRKVPPRTGSLDHLGPLPHPPPPAPLAQRTQRSRETALEASSQRSSKALPAGHGSLSVMEALLMAIMMILE